MEIACEKGEEREPFAQIGYALVLAHSWHL
jgi:hypothetical protein